MAEENRFEILLKLRSNI